MNKLTHDQKSATFVILLTLLALLLGSWVKTAVTNQTRAIIQNNLTAAIPADWLAQDGQGDLILLARNPERLHQRFQVRVLPQSSDLALLANEQSLQRLQIDDGYRPLAETAVIINGWEGYKVSFATVAMNAGGLPRVIEGADYYFPETNNTLVISFQSDSETYDDVLAQFQAFLSSVSYGD